MPEYIERETLIKAARIMPRTIRPELVRYSTVQAIIDKQPAADVVEVVHGEWKFNKDGSGTCNQCGITQKNVWDYDGWQNYCGHCGADMRGIEKRSADV